MSNEHSRMTDAAASSRAPWSTLGTALYLACSWTWCIGMFLPLLLVRDFGMAGYWVFVVPNVIGAAALGFVLKRATWVDGIVTHHRAALKAFSIATIAFQFYFLAALLSRGVELGAQQVAPPAAPILAGVVLAVGFIILVSRQRLGPLRWLAGLVWLASVVLLGLVLATPTIAQPVALAVSEPSLDPHLAALAPAVILGFLLCPYLDLTFLSARRAHDLPHARIAFAVGFGFFFLVMILGTLLYASIGSERAMLLLVAHLAVQITFTASVHASELIRRWGRLTMLLMVVCGVGLAIAGGLLVGGWSWSLAGLSSFEIGYRLFMSLYGLVFPAYVWICMLNTTIAQGPTARHRVGVWLAAIVLAAPFYWMGFIERQELWLIPGVAIVLAARLSVPGALRGPRPSDPVQPVMPTRAA